MPAFVPAAIEAKTDDEELDNYEHMVKWAAVSLYEGGSDSVRTQFVRSTVSNLFTIRPLQYYPPSLWPWRRSQKNKQKLRKKSLR